MGRWFAIDPALQAASPYMAMGNNPMMMIDEDGKTWGIFKAIGNAWDYAWDKGNQFARWADKNGIPAMNFGAGMNSAGQVNPLANVNGQELDLTGKAASINRGIAYAMNSFSSQRYDVKRKFPVVWADALIFNGAWSYDPKDEWSNYSLEQVQFTEWYKQSSGRVEQTESPIDYMLGAGIGKALLNGGRKIVGKTITKGGMQTLTKAEMALVKGGSANWGGNLWKVGSYKSLRGLEVGLDAHHVGQKALMKRFVPGYNAKTAPSILVPKLGHTVGKGSVSRSMSGFTGAIQVLARDIFELRRVYGLRGIPNSSLQQLIQMNKQMYSGAFVK